MAEEKYSKAKHDGKLDTATSSAKTFFISYNGADKTWAEWIAWQLEEAGFSAFLQAWDFRPGANFVLKMQEVSEKAERTIAILSPDYLSAEFTQPEWAAAFRQDPKGVKNTLVPIMVRDCKRELAGLWPQIVYINLVGLSEQEACKALLEGINCDRNKPTTPPPFPGAIQHNEAVEPHFPGKTGSIPNPKFSEEKLTLSRLKLNRSFNPYSTRDEWIEYITSNLEEIIGGEDYLDFYTNDAQGQRQIRILSNGKTIYSLDIFKGSMGGSRGDGGISFACAEGKVTFSGGFNATGNFKWNRQKEISVLELLNMSLLSHIGVIKEYTKEEFLEALWDKIRLAIERLAIE